MTFDVDSVCANLLASSRGNPFLEKFVANVKSHPDALYCHFISASGETKISRQDLLKDSLAFASNLTDQPAGSTILLFLRHTPKMHSAFLGCMLAGCTPSFMPCTSPRQDPSLYWNSHQILLDRIRPEAIVASENTFLEMRCAGLDLKSAKRLDIDANSNNFFSLPSLPHTSDTALLQHSSGTTGLKKGVKLSYSALERQVSSYARALDLTSRDCIASWLPLYHDMGLIACWILPLYHGNPIIHMDPFEWLARPESLFDRIQQHQATLCWMPNFAFEHLTRLAGERAATWDLSSIRAFIDCSESCRFSTLVRFVDTFAPAGVTENQVLCCYAMAETVFAVTQSHWGAGIKPAWIDLHSVEQGKRVHLVPKTHASASPVLSVGKPIEGAKVVVRDSMGVILPDMSAGEITISSDFLFSGYNEEPEKTKDRMRDGWYYSRDTGFVLDGDLYILGRIDDLIIVNGKNVYAHDVEAVVCAVTGTKPGRAVALGVPDDDIGSSSLVIIAEHDGGTADHKVVRREVIEQVYARIGVKPADARIVEPNWLTKTTSGKISRKENLAKYLEQFRRRKS